MPTTWFFDASGTNSSSRTVVLSGVSGSDAAWFELDKAWRDGLEQLNLNEWHSKNYFRRQSGFEKPIPIPLLNVIGQTMIHEFGSVSFALDKAGAELVRQEYPDVIPSDENILMNLCFSCIGIAKGDRDQPNQLRIVFDRGEPFINELKPTWQKARRALRQRKESGWPTQVREIESASSAACPGLQMADLLSWTIRSQYEYHDNKEPDGKIPMLLFSYLPKLRGGLLDSGTVRAIYVDQLHPDLRHTIRFD
jgi:hypothetical protein